MFIIGKIISDGETNFTQHKYNKLQNISEELSVVLRPGDYLFVIIKFLVINFLNISDL